MKTRVLISFFLIICLLHGKGWAERGLELRTQGGGLIDADPRNVATALYTVTNTGSEPLELMSEPILPDGWKPITDDFIFTVDPGETLTRLFSFFIPQTAMAGLYEISLRIRSRTDPSISESLHLHVNVRGISSVSMQILNGPEFVIAGNEYAFDCLISNNSNQAVELKMEVSSSISSAVSFNRSDLHFEPAESKSVQIGISTTSEIRRKTMDHLTVTAWIAGESRIIARATHKVDVIPRIQGSEDRYHRFPVKVSLNQFATKTDSWESGFQTQISGSGPLDEKRNNFLSFDFKLPDTRDKKLFGQYDEYRMELVTDHLQAGAGDLLYTLSPLTENGFSARGAEGSILLKDLRFGGFTAKSRMPSIKEEQTAGYAAYNLMDRHVLSVNYLSKTLEKETSRIWSMFMEMKSIYKTDLALEYAGSSVQGEAGENGRAWSADILHKNDRLIFKAKGLKADSGFQGDYKDGKLLTMAGSFRLNKAWSIGGDIAWEKQNPHFDLETGIARKREYRQLRLNRHTQKGQSLYLDIIRRDQQDLQNPSKFNFRENSIRLGAQSFLGNFNFNVMAEAGNTDDKKLGKDSSFERYTLITGYAGISGVQGSGYLSYDTGEDFDGFVRSRITYGLNLRTRFGDHTNITLSGRSSSLLASEHEGFDHDLRASVEHTLDVKKCKLLDQSVISAGVWRSENSNPEQNGETSVFTALTIPFRVPVSRKKEFGSVKGRVYDKTTDRPLSDVMLKIGDSMAITDKNGGFTFPGVKAGTHYLSADFLNPENKGKMVFCRKMPDEILVKNGDDTILDLPVVESSGFTGRITVYDYQTDDRRFTVLPATSDTAENATGKDANIETKTDSEMVETGGLDSALIEMTRDGASIRRLTDKNGRFAFDSLVPGKYRAKIQPGHLPDHHRLEKESFEIELVRGENKEMEIKVLPVKRQIKMLPNAPLVIEEDASL